MRRAVKIFYLFIAAAVAAVVCLRVPSSAKANSAVRIWGGVQGSGVVSTGEFPLEVRGERLTFHIGDLPTYTELTDPETYADYGGKVTARYEIFNPSEDTVIANLAFPYATGMQYGFYGDAMRAHDEKYAITLDGRQIGKRVRCTFSPFAQEDFNIETELPKLRDDYAEHAVYATDAPVTEYRYDVSLYGSTAEYRFVSDAGKRTRLYCKDLSLWERDGEVLAIIDSPTVVVYAVGEGAAAPVIEMSHDASVRAELASSAQAGTFRDVFLGDRWEKGAIGEIDMFNALTEILDSSTYGAFVGGGTADAVISDAHELMMWYEYDITVPPKASVINEVTAPLIPDIDDSYNPAMYEYRYLLSPASTFASFGTIEVKIDSPDYPYFMLYVGGKNYARGDLDSDTLTLDGLPEGELHINISRSAAPEPAPRTGAVWVVLLFLLGGSMFGYFPIIPILIVVAIIIIVASHKRKKKKKQEELDEYLRAHPEFAAAHFGKDGPTAITVVKGSKKKDNAPGSGTEAESENKEDNSENNPEDKQ